MLLAQAISKPKELISYKLFTDKITLSKYRHPIKEFNYLNIDQKQHSITGEISCWNWTDALRRQRSFSSSLNRSLRTLNELSTKNLFAYFLTITFNQLYVDRRSAEVVHRKFKNVMKRLKYAFGGMSYIAVAEHHKDQAIHYHIMCNFMNKPKLHYVGKTVKGNAFYYIMNDFKKEDCFLVLEKLKSNNLGYLTKYMTKDADYPLYRKFSATRDLERSRLVDKIKLDDNFDMLKANAICQGFGVVFDKSTTSTYEYKCPHGERERAAVDLLRVEIKDENLIDFYYSFISNSLEILQHGRKKLKRIKEIREEVYDKIQIEKLPIGQLSFVAPKNFKTTVRGEYYWN